MVVGQTTIVNPGFGVIRRPVQQARVDRSEVTELAGRSVALFSNNKPNVSALLDELEHLLRERLSVARTTRATKLSSAFPASEEELKRAEGVEYLIDAVGD
jgi:hypothetical protein